MESPSSHQPPLSARLFLSLITCYSIRQQLFDNLTPYSVACLLHIFKAQLRNEVGTVEKQRFLNPIRCLFDNSEMQEIEERVKKGHAIILWGKDLELMTQLLQDPEPETHESWPQKINLAISQFVPEGSEPIGSFFLPGHWKHTCDGLDVPTKVTTPEPGILLQDMTVNEMKAWRAGEKTVLTLWCSLLEIELMAGFVHHDFGGDVDLAMLECKFDCSVPYINLHERPSILKTVESPNTVACIISFGLQLSFEIEGSNSTSPTLEDALEMR